MCKRDRVKLPACVLEDADAVPARKTAFFHYSMRADMCTVA